MGLEKHLLLAIATATWKEFYDVVHIIHRRRPATTNRSSWRQWPLWLNLSFCLLVIMLSGYGQAIGSNIIVDVNALPGSDGSSRLKAFKSIRAVNDTPEKKGGGDIWVADATDLLNETQATKNLFMDEATSLPTPVIEMVDVPAGSFVMGHRRDGDDGMNGGNDELPRHRVNLAAYQIGKYHVTNQQFCEMLNWALQRGYLRSYWGGAYFGGDVYANGRRLLYLNDGYCQIQYADGMFTWKSRMGTGSQLCSMADHPVSDVSWYGTVAFCNWLSEVKGLTPSYDLATWNLVTPLMDGYRLPTEAEWERAAAWNGSKHWIYGFSSDDGNNRNRYNHNDNLGGTGQVNPLGLTAMLYTSPVGWFNGINVSPNGNVQTIDSPSPVGCYDMSGNQWEWCQDWYHPDYNGAPSDGSAWETQLANYPYRVVRGGDFGSGAAKTRTASRDKSSPGSWDGAFGFRLARASSGAPPATPTPTPNAIFYVNDDAPMGGDGSSWTHAINNIQAGVDAAATGGGGAVWVAEGTYTGTAAQVVSVPNTVKVYGGFAGNERAISERNVNSHKSIIDGQNARRGVSNEGLLDGFDVKECRLAGNTYEYYYKYGGGILNSGTVSNCTVTGNSTLGGGGGIYNDCGTVSHCTITSNTTLYGGGGGIYNDFGTVSQCLLTNNSASTGGGIENAYGMVSDCTMRANHASTGGGIYNPIGTVSNCTISANSAAYGAGIFNSGILSNCMVTSNSATTLGGGIYHACRSNSSGVCTIINCTVAGNSGPDGAGIYIESGGSVLNSIIWANRGSDLSGTLDGVAFCCYSEAEVGQNGNLRANPQFVATGGSDPLAWDLRLKPDSPCIDAGTTATQSLPANDLAGNPRPGGDGRVDMGAYESPDEYQPGTPAPTVVVYVSPAGDGSTGQDWTHAYQSISRALQDVQTRFDLFEIRVAAGIYCEGHELVLSNLITLSGGWSGNQAQPEERDAAVYQTIVDGEKKYRCISNYGYLESSSETSLFFA